jgi:hypothetical protein
MLVYVLKDHEKIKRNILLSDSSPQTLAVVVLSSLKITESVPDCLSICLYCLWKRKNHQGENRVGGGGVSADPFSSPYNRRI